MRQFISRLLNVGLRWLGLTMVYVLCFFREKGSRTCVITMIRDEDEYIEQFVRHLAVFFDDIYIVDHQSVDNTRTALSAMARSGYPLNIFYYDADGFYKKQIMSWILKEKILKRDVWWAFFLDPDEYLPFDSRESFISALAKAKNATVLRMKWLNIFPVDMSIGGIPGDYMFPDALSSISKVAVQPKQIFGHGFSISQGNHDLLQSKFLTKLTSVADGFPLIHVPIRNWMHFQTKLKKGVFAYTKTSTKKIIWGRHWSKLQEIDFDRKSFEEIQDIVFNYGVSDKRRAASAQFSRREFRIVESEPDPVKRCDLVRIHVLGSSENGEIYEIETYQQ